MAPALAPLTGMLPWLGLQHPGEFFDRFLPGFCIATGSRRATLSNHLRPRSALLNGNLIAIGTEHKEANSGGEISLLPVSIDCAHEVRQRHVALDSDLLQTRPKGIFKTDTGFVASDNDRAFHDRRFHLSSSQKTTPLPSGIFAAKLWPKKVLRFEQLTNSGARPSQRGP